MGKIEDLLIFGLTSCNRQPFPPRVTGRRHFLPQLIPIDNLHIAIAIVEQYTRAAGGKTGTKGVIDAQGGGHPVTLGIDVRYQPTGFSVGSGGQIREGYQDTFARIGQDGNIRGSYGELTGLSVSPWGTINKGY